MRSWKPSVRGARRDLARIGPRDRVVPVAREREAVGLLRGLERPARDGGALGVQQRRVLGEHVDHERRVAARARHAREVGRRIAGLDRLHLERRRVDVRDASALRVRDPDEAPGRDRRLVVRLDLLLGRRLGRRRRARRAPRRRGSCGVQACAATASLLRRSRRRRRGTATRRRRAFDEVAASHVARATHVPCTRSA